MYQQTFLKQIWENVTVDALDDEDSLRHAGLLLEEGQDKECFWLRLEKSHTVWIAHHVKYIPCTI